MIQVVGVMLKTVYNLCPVSLMKNSFIFICYVTFLTETILIIKALVGVGVSDNGYTR